MKLSVIILSIYILLLAVMPCPCERALAVVCPEDSELHVSCDCGHESQDIDLCTPFCVVSQCNHAPIALFINHTELPISFEMTHKNTLHAPQEEPVVAFKGAIWHPPILLF